MAPLGCLNLPNADAEEAALKGVPTAPRVLVPPNGLDAGAVPKRVVAGAEAVPKVDGLLLKEKAAADEAPARKKRIGVKWHL